MAKLLIEQINVSDIQTLVEEKEGKKTLFIEGIYLQGDIKNRNGRVYPKSILEREVARYLKESVDRRNAFGELDHPTGPKINPDRISHLIVSLKEDGANYIGKAKILDTPMGNIARNIMEGGGQLAVSSRGVGSVKQIGGAMQVQEDFMLSTAADIVVNPSAPSAYVEAILESPDWYFDAAKQEWMMNEVMNELHNTKKADLNEELVIQNFAKLVKAIIG